MINNYTLAISTSLCNLHTCLFLKNSGRPQSITERVMLPHFIVSTLRAKTRSRSPDQMRLCFIALYSRCLVASDHFQTSVLNKENKEPCYARKLSDPLTALTVEGFSPL